MAFIGRIWRGEERLWKVFWLYGVLLGLAIGLVLGIVEVMVGPQMKLPNIAFQIIYSIWITVGEWRSAFNVNWRGWGYIMRGVIIVSIVLIVVGFVFGFTMVGKDLIAAAECRKELKVYLEQGGTEVEAFKEACRIRTQPVAAE